MLIWECDENQNIKITAIDILDIKFKHRNINFYKKDFTQIDFKSFDNKFDLILSDMAPNTTGHKSTDHLKISNLINNIIDILDLIANFNSNNTDIESCNLSQLYSLCKAIAYEINKYNFTYK